MENKEIDTCKLLYNTERVTLHIPEYGRNVQKMVDYLKTIEDREKRNQQAKAVIKVMEILNPAVHLQEDYEHKLWDHLFIMSDFRLDVDSPYPLPTREDLKVKPEKLNYSQGGISHKHYGKNIVSMLRRTSFEEPTKAEGELRNIARYLRNKSSEYNHEFPNSEVILNDIKNLSEGAINLDEDWLKKVESEHKSASSHQKSNKRQAHSARQSQKGGRRNTQRHNNTK